jgi:hypothetical protein
MANTFTLEGTSSDAQNNTAYAGRYMVLRVTSVGTDTEDIASYPKDSVSFLIGDDGTWTSGATLWVNGDSGILSHYEMLEPSGERIEFIFPSEVAGTTVRYEYALENYLAEDAVEQQSPALAAHLADTGNPHDVTYAQAGAQQQSDRLDEIAALTPTDGNFQVGNGTAWVAESETTARASLGVAIGTDVQAYDSVLDNTTASYTTAEETKLAGIEALADVTDAANVIAAGAYTVGGTDVAVADGGTGASTAADARTNIGFADNVASPTTPVDTTSYTVLSTDRFVLIDDDAAGGDVTVTLPSASTLGDGWGVDLKKLGSTGDLIIDPDGTETIDGDLTRVIRQKLEATHIISDGVNWNVVHPTLATGWAQYIDGEHTVGSPLAVNNAKVQLTIDPAAGTGSKIETYLPAGVTEFWNSTTNKIIGQKEGDAYTIRVNFVGDPAGVSDYGEIIFDIGDGAPDIPIATRTVSFAKATPTSVSTTTSLFSLDTFIANGCKIYFDTSTSGDSVDVYDISVVITRTFSPL